MFSVQVSSTEANFRSENNDFSYNLETARAYQTNRGGASAVNHVPQYVTDSTGDVMASYRQSPYYGGGKGYYSPMSGWAGAYAGDDIHADWGIVCPQPPPAFPLMGQDLSQSYSRYGSGPKASASYVDSDAPTYSYGNLVHRPAAVSNDSPNFSLTSMAASLPNPSDRLLPNVNRTLTNSSYRTDGLSSQYTSGKLPASQTSATSAIADVGYNSLNAGFDTSSSYSSSTTLAANASQRSSSHSEAPAYHTATSAGASDLYSSDRPDDAGYLYGDRLGGSRRDSHSSGGAASSRLLANNQAAYVPDSHNTQASAQAYAGSQAAEGATTSTGGASSSGSGTSRVHLGGHRRSAGSLRGA